MPRSQRTYVYSVVAAGVLTLALAVVLLTPHVRPHAPVTLTLLVLGVIGGELMPIRAALRRSQGELTVSTAFAFALLIAYGPGAALPALALGSFVVDVFRKDLLKASFNSAQYALSLAPAAGFMALAGFAANPMAPGPGFAPSDLVIILGAGVLFYLANSILVATVIALGSNVSVWSYFVSDFVFQAASTGLSLGLAPLILLSADFTPLALPLTALPLFALHRAGREAARSEYQASHDNLTGLPNRVLFAERLNDVLNDAQRSDDPFAVMLMDLDHFKEINDTLGHGYGDRVLELTGARLKHRLRSEDMIARLGGDEFAVLVADIGSPTDAYGVGIKVLEALSESYRIDDLTFEVGGSVGIACFPEHGRDAETLMRRADIAMYAAKRSKMQVALYTPEQEHHTPERLALAGELRAAIEEGRIETFLQPVIDTADGQVVSAEALARWRHPERGIILPADFIPIAEQTGLVGRLTSLMLDGALAQAAALREAGIELSVAVNLSARSFLDGNLIAEVEDALQRHDIAPHLLKLEITESMVIPDPHRAMNMLNRLKAMGVETSIDDFGTGYSSLTYLTQLPVSEIKIDKSFVMRLPRNDVTGAVVKSIVRLAHDLKLRVVGEGVADAEVFEELRALGCDLVQGFHFSPALAPPDVLPWLLAHRAGLVPSTHPADAVPPIPGAGQLEALEKVAEC